MVEIDAGESAKMRRPDIATAVAIVLAVDAVVSIAIAVVGVPFLLFVFGDEDGTWHRLWPYAVSWVGVVALAAVAAASAARFAGFGGYPIRVLGTSTALGTAAAALLLAPASIRTMPGWLAICLPIVAANLATAWALIDPAHSAAVTERLATGAEPDELPDPAAADTPPADANPRELPDPREDADPREVPASPHDAASPQDADPRENSRAPVHEKAAPAEVVHTRDTIDLHLWPSRVTRRRRSRGPAALRSMSGVRLPPRARRKPRVK